MRRETGHAYCSSRFPETSWGLVLATRAAVPADGTLETLCRRYWPPVYAALRRRGLTLAEAEDFTQGFFLHLIEHGTLARADPLRGRFRNFLLGSLRWFLANAHARARAGKRGDPRQFVAIDSALIEASLEADSAADSTFELQFDRQWARTVVANALAALCDDYTDKGQARAWEVLRCCLDPAAEPPAYATLAARLGSGEGAVKVAVHRLRSRFRSALREEVARTVATAKDIEDELRYLHAVLAAQLRLAGTS